MIPDNLLFEKSAGNILLQRETNKKPVAVNEEVSQLPVLSQLIMPGWEDGKQLDDPIIYNNSLYMSFESKHKDFLSLFSPLSINSSVSDLLFSHH